ncbi:MAG: membrane protein insertion efficiency factor YidD [Actinomycetota bacterium]|nr:membrane protein insertion efficiency factor YidD [Actinomycetota bacterium]MDA3019794.1 membrane protein insertion efficiency factor YidD [Actinomycetota bacterium]
MKSFLLKAINWYQVAREGRPSPCRFSPSCSEYAKKAVDVHGAGRGTWLTVRRLVRCRPFGPSGFDPVPEARFHQHSSHQHDEQCSSMHSSSTEIIHPTRRVS